MKSIFRRLTGKSTRAQSVAAPDVTPPGVELENLEPRLLFSAAPVEAPSETDGADEPQAAEESVAADTPVQQGQVTDSTGSGQDEAAPAASGETEVGAEQGVNLVSLDEESATLNQETLDAIASAAAQRWIDSGISAEQTDALSKINYQIADLGGNRLGVAAGSAITIDDNAGGGDWFIDTTPEEDGEYQTHPDIGLSALFNSDATGSTDLLTVLLHEQGHVLGIEDVSAELGGNVMNSYLSEGTRRLPSAAQGEGAIPGALDGAHFMTASALDTSFNGTGSVSVSTGGTNSPSGGLVQSDGKIIVVGTKSGNMELIRFNPNGTLDSTFGTGGILTITAFGPYSSIGGNTIELVQQADGKIVGVAQAADYDGGSPAEVTYASDGFAFRLNDNGTFDTGFGTNGIVTVDLFALEGLPYADGDREINFESVAIQDDQKIVIGGDFFASYDYGYNQHVIRLNTNGSLDSSFSGNGVFVIAQASEGFVQAVAIDENDKIVAAGITGSGDGARAQLFRLNSNGTVDASFGTSGFVATDLSAVFGGVAGKQSIFREVAIFDGKIIAGGSAKSNGTHIDFAFAKFDSNGSLDTGFGTNGVVIINPGNNDTLFSMAVDTHGKITAAGQKIHPTLSHQYAVYRLNNDGTPDANWGTGGELIDATRFEATEAMIDGNGRVIVPHRVIHAGTSYDINVYVGEAPVASNTAPTENANTGLTVNEGSSSNTIGQSALEFTDAEEGAGDVTFTIDILPANGTLHVGGGAAIALGATFTQAQINSNALTYNHDGSETTSDSFRFDVADGAGGAVNNVTFALTITPQNDAPAIFTNTGLTVNEGGSGTIASANLNENDPDDSGAGLTYTVTALPGNGSVKKNGTALILNGTFTQADVDANNVTYEHDGSETTSDSFNFSLADGGENGASAATGTFNLTITPQNDSPLVGTNAGLTVNEGASGTITNVELNENDPDDSGTGLTYTVTALPGNGSVKKNGTALVLNGTFTQDDIDNSLVTYEHDGSATTSDSFDFSLADGGENGATAATGTFNLTITPQNDSPAVGTNAGLTVNEGASGTIGNANLNENDPDDSGAGLTYTVTSLPGNGSVKLGASALLLNGTFTQADVDANNVTYEHDGSETTSDSFNFSLADGLEDGATAATGTFSLTITPQNDSPAILTNAGLTVLEGASGTIGTAQLNEDDPDDAGADLIYTVTDLPDNGSVKKNGTALNLNETFTQADVDANNVTYEHNGSATTSDSFDFSLADGGENGASAATGTFNITVTPAAPAGPNSASVSGTDLTIEADGDGDTVTLSSDGTTLKIESGDNSIVGGNGTTNSNGDVLVTIAGLTSITIDAGGDDDTININSLTGFTGSLDIMGGDGQDLISFAATVTLGLDNDASLSAEEVYLNHAGIETTGAGSINIDATGSSGGTSKGVNLAASNLTAGGTGSISLNGAGGDSGANNQGVQLSGGSTVSTNDGDIDIDGSSSGSASANQGISLLTGSSISAGGSGNLTIDGTGSSSGTSSNHGVSLAAGTSASVENGNMIITGAGAGSGGISHGVNLLGSLTGIGTGNISVTGSSTGTGNNNLGVYGSNASIDTSTGSGSVTLRGTGSTGGFNSNYGVGLANFDIMTGGDGGIDIDGLGGGTGAGTTNNGVSIETGSELSVAGTGSMTIDGTGGSGTNNNRGVYVVGAGSSLTSDDGNVEIRGTANGTAGFNHGMEIKNTALSSTGTGSVTLEGTGSASAGAASNLGIYLLSNTISAVSGDMTLTGIGGTGTNYNEGVRVQSTSVTTGGTLAITGTTQAGTTGSNNSGIYLSGATLNGGAASMIDGSGGGGSTGNHGITNVGVLSSNLAGSQFAGHSGTGGTSTDLYGTFPV